MQGVPKKIPHTGCPKKNSPYRVSQKKFPIQGVPKKIPIQGVPKKIPHTGCPKKVSHTGCHKKTPHTGCTKRVPQKIPHTGCTKKVPHTGCPKKIPHTGRPKKAPHTGCHKKIPIQSVPKKLPIQDITKKIPHTECPKKAPHTGCPKKKFLIEIKRSSRAPFQIISNWSGWRRQNRAGHLVATCVCRHHTLPFEIIAAPFYLYQELLFGTPCRISTVLAVIAHRWVHMQKDELYFIFLKYILMLFHLGLYCIFNSLCNCMLYHRILSKPFCWNIWLKYFGEILSFDNIGILVSTTDFYLTQKFHSPRKKTQIIVDVTKYHELIIDITIS